MTSTTNLSTVKPESPTGFKDRMDLLKRATRPTVPLRKTFVQAPPGSETRVGPLSTFVANGDLRGLRAYLIAVAATSKENEDGWSTTLDSLVWARLIGADKHVATDGAARIAAWRTLGRLEQRHLLIRRRPKDERHSIQVTLLREDGSGAPYTLPASEEGPENWYLRIPTAFWKKGIDEKIELPGLAMLLTLLAEKSWTSLPAERMPEWYGWSADTTERGFKNLLELGIATRRVYYKRVRLSAHGSTMTHQYNLKSWLRPPASQRPESQAAQTA